MDLVQINAAKRSEQKRSIHSVRKEKDSVMLIRIVKVVNLRMYWYDHFVGVEFSFQKMESWDLQDIRNVCTKSGKADVLLD
jgi:hypothetical protein